jgi:proteasome lid subunit RPN8/RPN11/molybdopterin converting factor small subunit
MVNERADSPANRYQVSALVLHRAEQALEAEALEVVGYYHSHPDHPARYSDFDRDHALPNMSYVITSVRVGAVADTRSWRLRDDRSAMDEETINTEDTPMSVTIAIPAALRAYTDGQASVRVAATTAGQALDSLTTTFPGLARHLRDGEGKLRTFVNVYLQDEDIRFLQKDATPLKDGDTLVIVPSIAGGR